MYIFIYSLVKFARYTGRRGGKTPACTQTHREPFENGAYWGRGVERGQPEYFLGYNNAPRTRRGAVVKPSD